MAAAMADVSLSICVTGAADSPHESERARALARLGHHVRMISPHPAKIEGVPVIATWGRHLPFSPLRRLAMMASTLLALARAKADIVQCHYAAEYATWAAALLGKRPLVITVMGGDVLFDEQGSHGAVGRALTRFALRRADLVTVKSPRLGDVVAAMGVPRERIMDVLWGIDLGSFKADPQRVAALRAEWGATDNTIVLLSPRPLTPFYNHALMVEALPAVVASHPGTLLVLSTYAETEGYRAALVARAKELGVENRLRFAPPRPHAAMADLYGASDIVLSLPASDGFPQTLVEAAATGRPCVMVGPERFAGLIAEDEHAVFVALTAESLAGKVLSLTGQPDFAARIAANALAFSQARADLMTEARRVAGRMRQLAEAS